MKFAPAFSSRVAVVFAASGAMLTSSCMQAIRAQTTEQQPNLAIKRSFTNPILHTGADPWVTKHNGAYYYCGSGGGAAIFVGKSDTLQTIGSNTKSVWFPPKNGPYSKEIWAPELHFVNGKWYIYVAADEGENASHQMYVLRAKTDDPQGEYEMMGPLDTGIDTPNGHEKRWAIDGSVLQLNDKLYFLWSGWPGVRNIAQHLYIAPMSNPWTLSGPRVLISKAELPWELNGRPLINEGPEALQRNGRTFIIYSASGSWSDDYNLGQLELVGENPLDAKSWKKHPEAVFAKTREVFGPGHASFVNDGQRDWIIYHTAKFSGAGWNRDVRMQPFTWNADGTPHFGVPVSPKTPIEY